MSYEAWGDDGDFETDHLIDAGWWIPDDVQELRDLLKFVDLSEPRPGNRSDAALILINAKLNDVPDTDPHVVWAQILLKDAT